MCGGDLSPKLGADGWLIIGSASAEVIEASLEAGICRSCIQKLHRTPEKRISPSHRPPMLDVHDPLVQLKSKSSMRVSFRSLQH